MTEDADKVECSRHGQCTAAYVCQHLAAGQDLGFHWGYDPEDPFNPYPDAWCDSCEAVVTKLGEWTDDAAAAAGIKVVCSECYAVIRGRNWNEDAAAYQSAISEYLDDLQEAMSKTTDEYALDKWERWDWDMESEELVFSQDGRSRVVAKVAFVGTYSEKSETWMWAWGNGSLPDNVRTSLRQVKEEGAMSGFLKLASAHWPATDCDGWDMTAYARKVLGGIGGYRTPTDTGHIYMVIMDAHIVQ